ncbi:MAG: hypothetical protein JXR80_05730 [Deltaproteobacteria bacterium]|nr:hypothetical protein [Deltaproteobacteria bacterium]
MRKSLLRSQNFILFLALFCGLGVGGLAASARVLVLPALGLVMTLSSMGVSGEIFSSPRTLLRPVMAGIGMSYVVLGGTILLMSHFLIRDPAIRAGFILMAAVPPAVAVIPFSVMFHGNLNFTMLATIGAYLSALLITPLLALLFLGSSFVQPLKLLIVLVELILLPLIGSRLLLKTPLAEGLNRYRGDLINWLFFLVIYTLVGINRQIFLEQPLTLIPIAVIALTTTFGLGWLIEKVCRRLALSTPTTVSLVLLGTLKNYGTAAGLGLVIYGKQATLPATVATIAMILYALWLGLRRSPRS